MRLQRVGQKILTIGNPGLSVISPRGGAAIPWYLSGGVSTANCIAAYQPLGAASETEAKVNLANPGTFTAYPSTTDNWSAEAGWTGNIYYADIVVSADYYVSIITRVIDPGGDNSRTVSVYNSVPLEVDNVHIYTRYTDNKSYYRGYNTTGANTAYTAEGVFCIVPGAAYFNGSSVGTFSIGSKFAISKIKLAGGAITRAVAIYNKALSSDEVAAITTAMNAL